MNCDYKCILIIGLIIGGLASIYVSNTDLASVIFGGLIGYLSHGVNTDVIRDDTNDIVEEDIEDN